MLVHWLALGGVRIQTWALDGTQRHIEGMWQFVASLRIPFGDEDYHDIAMERLGLQRREVAQGEELWRLRHVGALTQLEVGPHLGPTDAPSWSDLWRFEAYVEPWTLRRGPPMPDDDSPYPGIGTFQLRRRLRMQLLTMHARVLEWEVVRYHFDSQEIEILVHILAPFPNERAWLREGNGLSHEQYAARHPTWTFSIVPWHHADVGTQTEEAIYGEVPRSNVHEPVQVELARPRARGEAKFLRVERMAEAKRVRRIARREQKRCQRQERAERRLCMRTTVGLSDQGTGMPAEGLSEPPPQSGDDKSAMADFEGPGPIAREFTLVWGGGESLRLAPAREGEPHDSAWDSDGFRMVPVRREQPPPNPEGAMESTLGKLSELGSDEDLGFADEL